MSSRLGNRAKKQEKYKRHLTALASSASKEEAAETSEDRNVPETRGYNPIKPKTRYVAGSGDESAPMDEPKTDFKTLYRNKIANHRRVGRSLTRSSGINSRSSSASSNNSQEPGKIVPRPRPGRSLTRASSIDSKGAKLPTRRSLSKSKPPVPTSVPTGGSNFSDSGNAPADEAATGRSNSLSRKSKYVQGRLRTRSISQEPPKTPTSEKADGEALESKKDTTAATSNPNITNPRLTRRSPFQKLLAEKKASTGRSSSLKRKPLGGKSLYDVKSTLSSASKDKDEKSKATTDKEAKDSIAKKDSDVSATPSDEAEEKPKVEEAPTEGASEEPALVDESEGLNVSVLSQENVKQHANAIDDEIVDDYGDADPQLEELESEVTVNTSEDIQKYLPSNSILTTLATSPVHEVASPVSGIVSPINKAVSPAKEETVDVGNADVKDDEKADDNADDKVDGDADPKPQKVEPTDSVSEEKKEEDEDREATAEPDLSKFASSQDEYKPDFDEDVWEPELAPQFSDSAISEHKAAVSSPKKESSNKSTASDAKSPKAGDAYDMFDTSSWAAGSVTDFSNASFPHVEVDINAERNFVNMMMEESKFRTLSDKETQMVFEANERISQAEEKAKEELQTVKDDEPLIVKRSNSVEGSEANTAVSLEDRLKNYETVEPDEESGSSSEENDGQESDSDDTAEKVEYVEQTDNDKEADEPAPITQVGSAEAPINLVGSEDVPTLEVAASAASASSVPAIPRSLSELKKSGAPPPPPPPGGPKKKKKKKKKSKSKSSSNEEKKVPLIPPPSEEKLKNWKGEQQKAKDYVAAMAEKLAQTASKTLDASSEYFSFKPVIEPKDIETQEKKVESESNENESAVKPDVAEKTSAAEDATKDEGVSSPEPLETNDDVIGEVAPPEESSPSKAKKAAFGAMQEVNGVREKIMDFTRKVKEEDADTEEQEDDSVAAFAKKVQLENAKTVSIHTEPKYKLWQKEVDDALGLVQRLEEEQATFPELAMFPSPLSDEEIAKQASEEIAKQASEEIAKQASEEQAPVASEASADLAGEDIENKVEVSTQEIETSDEQQPVLKVDVLASPTRINRQESMFASPKSTRSTKANAFNEKTKISSSSGSILVDSKMADKVALASSAAANTFEEKFAPRDSSKLPKEYESIAWFSKNVLNQVFTTEASEVDVSTAAQLLLEDKDNFNSMCRFVAESVNEVSMEINPSLRSSDSIVHSFDDMSRTLSAAQSGDPLGMANPSSMSTTSSGDSDDKSLELQRILLKPVVLSGALVKLSSKYIAANFVSFLFTASKLTKVRSPFGDTNPFLAMIVESPLETIGVQASPKSAQELIFEQLDGKVEKLFDFVYEVKNACDAELKALAEKPEEPDANVDQPAEADGEPEIPSVVRKADLGRRFIVPETHPSPFEASISEAPTIVTAILSFVGDPVSVCRMKKINQDCRRFVSENEHALMQDAVRTGGIEARHRPAFWMHVALEKSDKDSSENKFNGTEELNKLELSGEEGKWHHVIQRDVERSFGNMPPHKMGAKFQSDSIVTALVTWGHNRLMARGVKGGGSPVLHSPPWKKEEENDNGENADSPPTDTVTDWGAASPKESSAESANDAEDAPMPVDASAEEIALCGNSLSADAKTDLQKKLSYILHTLAATYEDIGYCQGMDYVVAHLLRNLQDTIQLKAANKQLPAIISTASSLNITDDTESMNEEINSKRVVEETIVRVMDTFFVNYNLKHMYWPELRCLKTCCRVFERLIQTKLPVLADHFEHHDLNVGLFALGWFQTLFLYLPSMPAATVDHMWDIWLVERSFKIFFRVGTAILYLSQPTLLNHELEGMMTYLNTIPDATLLRPDILIPCALNIKVTNRLLQELEDEVMKNPN